MSIKRVSRFTYGLLVVWPAQWLAIASALVGIFTLGYYVPCWDVRWMFWAALNLKLYRK